MEEIAFVYWVFDDSCKEITLDGYVGVTGNPKGRFKEHQRSGRFPSGINFKIIYEGLRADCFDFENALRPVKGLGWNNAPGGARGNRLGFTHSVETKDRLKQAWTEERKAEHRKRLELHNQNMRGQKRPKQSESVKGEKNGMFGRGHSQESKAKISENTKGRSAHNKSNTRCEICDKPASPSVIKKYHGIGKKHCKK